MYNTGINCFKHVYGMDSYKIKLHLQSEYHISNSRRYNLPVTGRGFE